MLPPRPLPRSTRSSIRARRLLGRLVGLGVFALAPTVLRADPPAWWLSRGVLDPNAQANDFAAANQGQAKHIAAQAAGEMDAHLANGMGGTVASMLAAWGTPGAATNDFQAINLGQLKSLAKPFYLRLQAERYTDLFPWSHAPTAANDYALANVGQVKNVFSFDFSLPGAGLDLDHNGLPDQWEMQYFGHTGVNPAALVPWSGSLTVLQAFEQGLNPNDFYNGQTPHILVVSGTPQIGPANGFVPLPLIVSVTDDGGKPFRGAPVTFTVSQGGGQVQRSSTAAAGTSLTVSSDLSGQARVFFKLPDVAGNTSQVTAMTGSGSRLVSVPFAESSDDGGGGGGSYGSPFDPTNVTAVLNGDGSMDVTWTSNADPDDTDTINIQDFDENGVYHTIATAPAGATSCHIPAP